MKTIAAGVARLAVRRPALLVAAALFLLAASAIIIQRTASFDSEILNILPQDSSAVAGLRIFNEHFSTSRELAFVLEFPPGSDDSAADEFVTELSLQPWVLRVLDGPPTATESGHATLPNLIAPLLLGQSDDEFAKTVAALEPGRLEERIAGLASRTAAGSPLARFELENDPLGIIAPLAATLSEKLAVAETFALDADGVRIVPVITRQDDLGAEASRDLMRQVDAFLEDFGKRSDGLMVSVTGRAAYVDQISSSMQRDITVTSLVSILAVTCLFWFSFRSLLPLAGSVLILSLTCVVALAAGSMVFSNLSVIAMGFCSILIGLGDDFSLLLYQRFCMERAAGKTREAAIAESIHRAAPGILWVALTTSLGFSALLLSGSAGFGQLGILIGLGVIFGAVFMILLMPLFERSSPPPGRSDPIFGFCHWLLRRSNGLRGLLILLGAAAVALAPWRPLGFDISTRSLEPRDIPAAKALERIQKAFPEMFEPVMLVVPATAPSSELAEIERTLERLQTAGVVGSFSSPRSLVTDPKQVARNRELVLSLDSEGLERRIAAAEAAAGLRSGALDPGVRLLRALQSASSLSESLPATSPWWFVIDRALSVQTGDVVFYIRPANPGIERDRRVLEESLLTASPASHVTGWSQMLFDLVPWATRELFVFGGVVIAVILGVLLITYRAWFPLLLHAAALAFALAGTVATLKFLDAPINILNVLAFPLILAVGVDYGVHLTLAAREPGAVAENLASVMKPVLISGLTTVSGFGALVFADNPSLSGLGLVCSLGVAWSLFASLVVLAPALLILQKRPADPEPL